MKKLIILMLLPVFLWAGNAIAFDLSGTWTAESYCVSESHDPTDDPELSTIEISHNKQSGFFYADNPGHGELCGGVVDDEGLIHMTCVDTFFHGEFIGKKPHRIVGINHNTLDGATCTVEAVRQSD